MLEVQSQPMASVGDNPLTFITSVRYDANQVKVFNNVTFLYDPNWEYEVGNPTYPISFFYVKSFTESMASDISSKPMLFYNQQSDGGDGTKAGLMNIVADNIIIKPKTYKMEILIPANESTFKNASFNTKSMAHVLSFMANNSNVAQDKKLSQVVNTVNVSFDIIEGLLQGLYGSAIGVSTICNMMLTQQDYNKASIEFMWRNRRILKFKLWNGWKFKYLVIQNFEVTKVGENGDFYEGTLILQEVPILTFKNQKPTEMGALSIASSALGKAQKAVTKFFVDTMTSSIGE